MGHGKGFAGPGHLNAAGTEPRIGLIIPTVTAGGVWIEHHPHLHATLLRPDQGLLDGLRLQLELLEPKCLLGSINQGHHSHCSVIGHHQQLLVMVQMVQPAWGLGHPFSEPDPPF